MRARSQADEQDCKTVKFIPGKPTASVQRNLGNDPTEYTALAFHTCMWFLPLVHCIVHEPCTGVFMLAMGGHVDAHTEQTEIL